MTPNAWRQHILMDMPSNLLTCVLLHVVKPPVPINSCCYSLALFKWLVCQVDHFTRLVPTHVQYIYLGSTTVM